MNMNRGYAMLLSVLVLASVGTAVSTTLLLIGISSAQTFSTIEESHKAKALANTCAEMALQVIATTPSFVGSNSMVLGQGSCNYIVSATSGTEDQINATGIVGDTRRKVKVRLSMPERIILSWEEVSDF